MRAFLLSLCVAVGGPTLAGRAEAPVPSPVKTIVFVGDVSLAGRRIPKDVRGDKNPLGAFRDVFDAADVAVANLEGLLTHERPRAYSQSRLDIGASPKWAPIFADAKINLVGLANNHTWDGGTSGLLEHRGHVTTTGVAVMGAAEADADAVAPVRYGPAGSCVSIVPATIKSNRPRRKGAHAAYYRGSKGHGELLERVGEEAKHCLAIVYIHWGREAIHDAPKSVQTLAHRLVDAGARLVVGHHPHVFQGVEFYGGGAIAYSLGNFVFTNRTPAKRRTGVLTAEVTPGPQGQLRRLALHPSVISVRGFFPKRATAREAADLRERLTEYSAPWGTKVSLEDGLIVFRPGR
ncbi:MAG: poly-gamma-glutamate capsule biosynthesis protein CapA/YwtB (metallophosphatase superfamily) [Myxococcota bacterium]|jgi:poly-gamma-glutamate capsule biosynthesis protein CapA/YwtB (metallophosphatase superfamily)